MIIGQAVYLELACLRIIDFLLIGYLLPVHGLFDPRPLTGHYNNALPSSSSYPRPDREREGGACTRETVFLHDSHGGDDDDEEEDRRPLSCSPYRYFRSCSHRRSRVHARRFRERVAMGAARADDRATLMKQRDFRICNGEKRVVRYLFDWISLRGIKSW